MNANILSKGVLKLVNLNRRKAIHERCLNCVGWCSHYVKTCEFDDCALHHFRTGTGKQNAKARSQAIREYCLWCMDGQRGEISKCPSTTCALHAFRKLTIDHSSEELNFPENLHIEHSPEHQSTQAMQRHVPSPIVKKTRAYTKKLGSGIKRTKIQTKEKIAV